VYEKILLKTDLNLRGDYKAHEIITYQESRVCLKVIELCNEKGVTVLPIHDSMVVKKQHMKTLKEMMVEAYEVLGFVSVPKVTGG
jgi:hypothetical protein